MNGRLEKVNVTPGGLTGELKANQETIVKGVNHYLSTHINLQSEVGVEIDLQQAVYSVTGMKMLTETDGVHHVAEGLLVSTEDSDKPFLLFWIAPSIHQPVFDEFGVAILVDTAATAEESGAKLRRNNTTIYDYPDQTFAIGPDFVRDQGTGHIVNESHSFGIWKIVDLRKVDIHGHDVEIRSKLRMRRLRHRAA